MTYRMCPLASELQAELTAKSVKHVLGKEREIKQLSALATRWRASG
jgi:hypothetical protein